MLLHNYQSGKHSTRLSYVEKKNLLELKPCLMSDKKNKPMVRDAFLESEAQAQAKYTQRCSLSQSSKTDI